MAQNINPLLDERDNEILGLVNWSLPWVKAAAILVFLVGLQEVFFFISPSLAAQSEIKPIWRLALGVTLFIGAVHLFLMFLQGKKYVQTEKETHLGTAMAHLGIFLVASILSCLFSALTVMVKFGGDADHILSLANIPPWAMVTLPLFIALIVFAIGYFDRRRPFNSEAFTKQIGSFAKICLPRIRLVSLFAVWTGLLFIALYGFSFVLELSAVSISILLWGISLVGFGAGLGIYWRSVREIHRNPSLIYFERTLERLNLFWLIACGAFGLLFLSNFLPV